MIPGLKHGGIGGIAKLDTPFVSLTPLQPPNMVHEDCDPCPQQHGLSGRTHERHPIACPRYAALISYGTFLFPRLLSHFSSRRIDLSPLWYHKLEVRDPDFRLPD